MIDMIQKQNILLSYYREGKSQREIAGLTGIARKTVSKYIREYEQRRLELETRGEQSDVGEFIQAMVEAPAYHVGVRPKRKMTEDIENRIQEQIEENREKVRKGQRKQQKKAMDMYETLVTEGCNLSYSTVLRTIRSVEKKTKEAFIKAEYEPGNTCEFDWGDVKITIKGKLRVLQMAVFASAYGNYRWAYLFPKQATECFQEAHARFFEQVGGVYQTMVYDNMKVAVKRFVGTEKEPTVGLLKLSMYYAFAYRFCNIASGNEKPHVERSVEVVRRKAFAFRDTFETLEEANQYLLEVCEKRNQRPQSVHQEQTAQERLEQERPYLLSLPPLFDAARVDYFRVDKYATVVVGQNHYSVPDRLVGEKVMVKIYATRILCFYEEQKVAEHPRLTGSHEWGLQLEHYLDTLQKKPGAVADSAALHQASATIKSIFETYYTKCSKEFVELLHYIRDEGSVEEVKRSIGALCEIHPRHVTTDKIKVLCAAHRETKELLTTELSKETQEIVDCANQHLQAYDELFQTRWEAMA